MEDQTVQKNRVVSMEYTLWVDNEVMDSSDGVGPLEFLTGYGNIISGLEREMIGMKLDESKEVQIAPADAYGEYDQEAFMDVPRTEFPADMEVEQNLELSVTDEDGHSRYARVEIVTEDLVRLNFNHPLAGKDLKFKVKVVGLREPTGEELDHGHVHVGGGHHH